MALTHLQRLEAEAIHIMREVVATADKPVMLYSIGKDSSVMLRLAMKAFYPAKPPFPVLHVDTTWKFREMYEFRDRMVSELGLDLIVHVDPSGAGSGINPLTHGPAVDTDIMTTEALKQALDKYGFDAAMDGARRDEEKSRATERLFSFRSAGHRRDQERRQPELWNLYNTRKSKSENMRVFPLSNWTELDLWQYIHVEKVPVMPLDIAKERPVVERSALGLLRFVTCGSVDDGKSTLIGRLLNDAGMRCEDQGHEQDTRNIVADASTADAAIILVDARKGMLTQTRRHAYLVSLVGVRHVIVAVNKMDLVDYSEARFRAIEQDCLAFANSISQPDITVIPVSALRGDNVTERSAHMPWHRGPTLMSYLETVEVDESRVAALPFRLPVQWVNRPNQDFRGYCGTVASGCVRPGDRVRVHPSGRESSIVRIVTMGGDLAQANAGQSVTVTLADEMDISRGDVIAKADAPAHVADQFETTIVWMGEEPMLGGRPYVLKIGAKTAIATLAAPKYRIDVNTLEHLAARTLGMNEIGVCNLSLDQQIAFDPYRENREMGGFILVDRISNHTVGAGMLHFALRRADNIQVQAIDVDKKARAALKGQKPCIVWLTGLPAAGKSTIANLLDRKLHAMGRHTYLVDGDNVRHGLNRDLGFTAADRVENVRRVAELAKLMVDAGLIVLVSLISPFRSERRMARELVQPGEFIEVFVDVPLQIAEQRDPKGLYKKARRGELKNFTGIDSPYEQPEHTELRVDAVAESPEEATDRIIGHLKENNLIGEN